MRATLPAVCLAALGLTVAVAAQDIGVTAQGISQQAEEHWLRLASSVGIVVSVEDLSKTKLTGTLLRVDGNELTLQVGRNDLDVARSRVRRVTMERADSVKNGALTGIVVGAGLAAGSSCHYQQRRCGTGARLAFIAVGAAIWGAVAASIDSSVTTRVTLYEAPPRSAAMRDR